MPDPVPAFGLNRFDYTSPASFAEDAQRAEGLGWDAAFIPSSPLRLHDPYVMLAAVAGATERMALGPLIENPVMRDPSVLASSIATLDWVAPGRALLGLGVGDTAVRFSGRPPARVKTLEAATVLIRRLLAGEEVELGAARPARLGHARPVPVWIAAGGPRTLRMAGRVADGVFLRVGTHEVNLRRAVEAVHAGAREAGRDPSEVRIAAVFHTILSDDAERVALVARSMAAGYYEYSPMLFQAPGIPWEGPDVEELKQQVWPDFHHALDLVASGEVVAFLPDEAAEGFSLHGDAGAIRSQIERILALDLGLEMVVPHPVPTRRPGEPAPSGSDYIERFAAEVIAPMRSATGALPGIPANETPR